MRVIASALRHLAAAGAPAEALVQAAADLEAALAAHDAETARLVALARPSGAPAAGAAAVTENVTPGITEASRVTPCDAENVTRDVTRDACGDEKSPQARRQARYRAKKASRVTENVTPGITEASRVTPCDAENVTRDVTRDAPPLSDKERSPTPPKEINYPPSVSSLRSEPVEEAREPVTACEIPVSQPDFSAEADAAVRAYGLMAMASGLAVPRCVDGRRRQQLLARLREHGLSAVLEAIGRIGSSAWCRGDNDRGWRADFDFLVQPKSFVGLLEGKYDDRRARQRSPPRAGESAMIDRRERALANIRNAIDGEGHADHRKPAHNGPDIELGRGDFIACPPDRTAG